MGKKGELVLWLAAACLKEEYTSVIPIREHKKERKTLIVRLRRQVFLYFLTTLPVKTGVLPSFKLFFLISRHARKKNRFFPSTIELLMFPYMEKGGKRTFVRVQLFFHRFYVTQRNRYVCCPLSRWGEGENILGKHERKERKFYLVLLHVSVNERKATKKTKLHI